MVCAAILTNALSLAVKLSCHHILSHLVNESDAFSFSLFLFTFLVIIMKIILLLSGKKQVCPEHVFQRSGLIRQHWVPEQVEHNGSFLVTLNKG